MSRSKVFKLKVAALGAAMLLTGCAVTDGGGAEDVYNVDDLEPIVLTVSDIDVPTGYGVLALEAWMAEVTEKTDGKVTFESYYSGSLIPSTELVSGLASGIADIGLVSVTLSPDDLPTADWHSQVDGLVLQGDHRDPAVVFEALAANVDRTYSDGPLRQEYLDQNVVPLLAGTMVTPPPMMCRDDAVTTLDDAAGVSVRVPGQPWSDEAAELGMAGVSVPFPELYETFQRGVVDCVLTVPSTFIASGVIDLSSSLTLLRTAAAGGTAAHAINKDTWDGLPSIVQQIMFDAIPTYYEVFAQGAIGTQQELIALSEEAGVEIVDSPELNQVLVDYRAGLRDELISRAPAGVSDPEGAVAEAEEAAAEAHEFVVNELGLEPLTNFDDLLAAYANGADGIDLDLFGQHIAKKLEPYRPE
jgi:TRAP-type C4-dicarboxylate transport system substrate-binding protein